MPVEIGRGKRAKDPAREIVSHVVESQGRVRLELIDIRVRDGAPQFKLLDSASHVAWFKMEPGDSIRVAGPGAKRQDKGERTPKGASTLDRRTQTIVDQRFTLQLADDRDRQVVAIERDGQDVRVAVAGTAPDSVTWLYLQPGDRVKSRGPILRSDDKRKPMRRDSGQPLTVSEMVMAQIARSAAENGHSDAATKSYQYSEKYLPSKHHPQLEELLTQAPPPPKESPARGGRGGKWIKRALVYMVLAAPIMLSGWYVTKAWLFYSQALARPRVADASLYREQLMKAYGSMPPPGIFPGTPTSPSTSPQVPPSESP